MSKCTNTTGFNFSLGNGSSLGWNSNGNPCEIKTTSSVYNSPWTANSSNYNSAIRNLDESFRTLPESTPYVRPEFVPYTQPSQSFIPEPKYIPSVVNKPAYYTTGDNYVIQELTTNLYTLQNLVCMDFTGKQLGSDSCRVLNEAFREAKLPYLLTLVLTNNKIDDVGATYLADAISRGFVPNLSSLFIDNNNLTCKGKETLVKTACQIKWKQKISVTVDYGIVFPNQQTDLTANNWFALQQKYSNVDVGCGKVHTHPIIGGSFYYRGIPFMNEVVDTVKEEVMSKTLYQKLVINGYNRELIDSDLYYLGFSLSGSTKPTTSGVNLNLLLVDLHQNSIAAPGIYNFVHFFKGQNIREVNLSNNQIGDEGAKLFSGSLSKGEMPNLKKLHLEGNKITDKGEDALVNALKNETVQDVIITTMTLFEKYQLNINGSVDRKMSIYENRLEQAKARGVNVDNVVINKTFGNWLANKKDFYLDIVGGWAKCMITYDDVQSFAGERLIAKVSKRANIWHDLKDAVLCYFEAEKEVLQTEVGVKETKYEMLDVITSPELTGDIEALYDTLYH